jgi:SAM-dependent methyltransferase
MKTEIKVIVNRIISHTPFRVVHIGNYVRQLYFFRYIKSLPVLSFQEVLDAGCGPGQYTLGFARAYPHIRITGYDIEKSEAWDNPPPNVRFQCQDLLWLLDKECYNLCLCIDVLEHISGNCKVIENIYRSLRPGGYFYLHIPRPEIYDRRMFPKRFYKEFDNWADTEHIGERYTLGEIQNVLKSIGFNIIRAHCTFNFWGRLAWELDRITDNMIPLKAFLMPLLKIFAYADFWFPKSNKAATLVIAMKPSCPALKESSE